MELEIKIKKGSKIITKKVEVGASTILSMLQDCYVTEIYNQLCAKDIFNLGGYVLSIKDKD
nr:MAG TPA: hypothetical protein [Bacteriophage sp.]